MRAEISSIGAVTASFRFRVYGQFAQSSSTGPTYLGFASQMVDPSGLVYMRARWQDPITGRFMTHDPSGGTLSLPTTLNAFAYANTNPVMFRDPSGACVPFCLVLIPVAVPVIAEGVADVLIVVALASSIVGGIAWFTREDTVYESSTMDRSFGENTYEARHDQSHLEWVRKKLNVDKETAQRAIKNAKRQVGRGGRSVEIDDETGDIIDPRSGEVIGNIADE